VAAISTYLVDKFLDCLVNAVGFNIAGVWIQLHTADPGAAGTTAVAGNSTRKSVAFAAAAAEAKASNADIVWTAVSTSETYTHVSLWDASSAGNFLWAGALTASKAVNAGDTFTIPSGSLSVGIS
jgi:hypothetical protein